MLLVNKLRYDIVKSILPVIKSWHVRLQVTDAVNIFVSVDASADKLISDSDYCEPTSYEKMAQIIKSSWILHTLYSNDEQSFATIWINALQITQRVIL